MNSIHVPCNDTIRNMSQVDLQNALRQCVDKATSVFNEKEEYLIRNDLSERCICARFAIYLDREIQNSIFSDYVVDVEYNRGCHGKDHAIKQLDGKNIVVDLIVHKRGQDNLRGFDNLICIEMKKASQPSKLLHDKSRLCNLTDRSHGFHYKAGYMIVAFSNRRQGRYGLEIDTAFYDGHAYPG